MKIIVTAATHFELSLLQKKLKNKNIECIATGVGMMATAVQLIQIVYQQQPNLLIQMGIAGSFSTNLPLGSCVLVKKEFLGDLGVMENNQWNDIFDMQLQAKNEKPFSNKALNNKKVEQYNFNNLPIVNAVTINQITTQIQHANQLLKKYKPTIETMEGAALHYVANSFSIPYFQLRGISNYVGERNKANWQISNAINNTTQEVLHIIKQVKAL